MQTRVARIVSLCAAGVVTLTCSSLRAQLIVGTTTTTTTNPAAIYYDVTSGSTTTLWNSAANKKVNGIAADTSGMKIYSNDSARLNVSNYGSVGTAPTFIAGMYRTTDNVTFAATGVDGLCWANGKLYGSTSFPSTAYKRGIYSIATTSDGATPTPHCVMTPLWVDNSLGGGSTVLGEIDYNASNGLFYAVSSFDTTGAGGQFGLGLYSIDAFGTGAVNKVADFPTGRTKIDGLAIGGGKFWLTEYDQPTSAIDVYPYDLTSGTYGSTITIPLTDGFARASGATWASPAVLPEPTTLALAALLPLVAMRRRTASR